LKTAKSIVFPSVLLVIVALLITGLMTGAIGAAFAGKDHGYLPTPEVHLPAQQIIGTLTESHDGHGESHAVLPSGSFVFTNTILSALIASVLLIVLFFFSTRNMKLVPSGMQNFMEWIVESLFNFCENVAGMANARKFFPVIGTIFLFVSFNAWLGLVPIYQSFGYIEGNHIARHFFRPAGTDVNMPLAIAIVSFFFVEFWGLRTLGWGYLTKFFKFDNLLKGKLFQGFVDLFVGMLELLSEFVRVVSFTFRLFGNMLAGEVLLLVAAFLVPFIFSIPFYGLEVLVGFVQGLIFAGLTLVFAVLAVTPHAEAH
jgi:F-type H+-transporting ATPase subunit a